MRSLSLSGRRRRGTREPRYTRFSQQELPGWSGQPGPWQAALLLTAAAAALLALGGAALASAASVTSVSVRYDLACAPGGPVADAAAAAAAWDAAGSADAAPPCTLPLPPLPRPLPSGTRLYLHYALTAFQQNHRRYARSRWDAQLRGEVGGVEDAAAGDSPALDAACAPRARADPSTRTSTPTTPCGLVAWSSFNDTFQLAVLPPPGSPPSETPTPLPVVERGIATPGDGRVRFGNGSVWATPDHNSGAGTTRGGRPAGRSGAFIVPLSEDEHLQVWMRPAALPSFRKLWGVVEVGGGGGLREGAVVAVTVDNRFNSYSPGGSKSIVLTTASWLGGKNSFTGWALIGTGGAYGLSAAGLAGVGWARRRRDRRAQAWEM